MVLISAKDAIGKLLDIDTPEAVQKKNGTLEQQIGVVLEGVTVKIARKWKTDNIAVYHGVLNAGETLVAPPGRRFPP